MSQAKPDDPKDIPRKEEFQKYLEKAGVIDQLTKLLVNLYENPNRPDNAMDYIKTFLGVNDDGQQVKLQKRIDDLEEEIKKKDDEILKLKKQLNINGDNIDNNNDNNNENNNDVANGNQNNNDETKDNNDNDNPNENNNQ
mmetsp:Transcript_21281/g.26244  ORF Transcript_21281/g.26244 Transcript_21281/m.26244 type:complete len:140 (-) Transcript_21281:128-547(-)